MASYVYIQLPSFTWACYITEFLESVEMNLANSKPWTFWQHLVSEVKFLEINVSITFLFAAAGPLCDVSALSCRVLLVGVLERHCTGYSAYRATTAGAEGAVYPLPQLSCHP